MRQYRFKGALVARLMLVTLTLPCLSAGNADALEITRDMEALATVFATIQTASRRGQLQLVLPQANGIQGLLEQEGILTELEDQGATLSHGRTHLTINFPNHRVLRATSTWAARELAELAESLLEVDEEAEFIGVDTQEIDESVRKTAALGLATAPSGAALDSTILVRLRWTTPSTTNGGGVPRQYRLYKTTDHPSGNPFSYESTFTTAELVPIHLPGEPGSPDSTEVPLVVGHKYTFNLKSGNGAGWSGPSITAEDGRASLIRDLRDTPPPPPPPPDGICSPGCRTGDADGDGEITVIDVILILDYLYRDGPFPEYAVDVDSRTREGYLNPDGYGVSLMDAVILLNYLWRNEDQGLAPCFAGDCNE